MAYPALDCLYGADVGVATEKITDNLVLNAILLRCEGGKGSTGLIKFGVGSGVEEEPPIANCYLYIPEGEGSGVRRRVGIFSWSNEEEECNDDHIDGGLQAFSAGQEVL